MFGSAPIITETGLELILRATGGESFTFTKFQAGKGILGSGETPKTMTALKSVAVDDIAITRVAATEDDGYIQVFGQFDNSNDVASDFRWTELGLIAEDGEGNEYLYAYGYDDATAPLIKVSDGAVTLEQYISAIIAVGETENITANVIPNATYASKAEFDAHLADTSNPHHVTYSQAGAAATAHTHSANDITSGTLPPERGGTGVTTVAALNNLIGGKVTMGSFQGDGTNRKDITLGFKPALVFLFIANNGDSNYDFDYLYHAYYWFSEGNNVYQSGDSSTCRTMSANNLFARNRGGAAVTSTGFAVGYFNPGAGYNPNLVNMNNSNYWYVYVATK